MSTRKALLLPLALAAGLVTVVAALAASTTTSVTITTPKVGQSVSLKNNAYTAVAGKVAFASSSPATTRFYLRRDGCGTSSDNPHLSTTTGTDAGDGCGLIVDQIGPVGDAAPQATFTDYPASDGMPLAFNGTQPVAGQISLTGAQVGLAEITVTLEALVGGNAVDLGSGSGSAVLDPTGASTPVPFTIAPNTSLDGSDVQALDLRVNIHGPNVYSGFVALSGASWVDLPSYTASVNKSVQVSLDDPSFANAVPARIDSSGAAWSVALPTPAVGTHTIYARSSQGFATSVTAKDSFKVTK